MIPTLRTTAVLLASLAPLGAAQSDCPPLPETGVTIGDPVPIVPGDIPAGCSPFEILVGTYPHNIDTVSNQTLTVAPARGTSEPSFPKFGVIVGDPVVGNASLALEGVRGYPVQVTSFLSPVLHPSPSNLSIFFHTSTYTHTYTLTPRSTPPPPPSSPAPGSASPQSSRASHPNPPSARTKPSPSSDTPRARR